MNISGSTKYGRHRVAVTVTSSKSLYFCIEDDGEGIPENQIQDVFQRGHRVDTRQSGQGIGLAVASDIVSAYGGEIKLGDSETLGGAAVHIHFPES